ncbi:MAG: hypothetical protein QM802_24340 [Agriterribacter sp.]
MKKIFSVLLATTIALLATAQVQKAELQASGLTCSMCNNSISSALKKVFFIASVESDINNNSFILTFKPGIKPDFDLLKKKVQDAGFSVANLWVYAHFNQAKITNDEHLNVDGLNIHFLNVKNQILEGEKKIQIVDKDFIPAKSYKKYAASTTMECYKTGFMSACCEKKSNTVVEKQRVYHVTI